MERLEGDRAGTDIWVDGDNYLYILNSRGDNKSYFKCRLNYCPARAKIKNQQSPYVSTPHNHLPDQLEVEVLRLKSYLRLRSSSENISMTRILNDAEMTFSKEAVVAIGGIKSIKSTMYRSRSKGAPKIPENLREYAEILDMDRWHERYATELGPERMAFFKRMVEVEDGSVMVIFGSPTILRYADQGVQLRLHMDATFKVVPRDGAGSQLFVVHVFYNETVYPMLYVLMERKTLSAYVTVLRTLQDMVPQIKVHTVMADYEETLRNAVLTVFPGVQLLGCWFHFAQAVYKQAASIGLTKEDVDDETRRVVKMATVLPLLPEHLLLTGVRQMQIEAGNRPQLNLFLTYLEEQWLPAKISVYRQPQKTNNAVESVRRDILQIVSRKHPNIWLFTECLLRVEHMKSVDFLRSQDPLDAPRRSRYTYRRLNEKIERAQDKLDQDGDVAWFLQHLAITMKGSQNMFQTGLEHGDEADDIPQPLPQKPIPTLQNPPLYISQQPSIQFQQLQQPQQSVPPQQLPSQPSIILQRHRFRKQPCPIKQEPPLLVPRPHLPPSHPQPAIHPPVQLRSTSPPPLIFFKNPPPLIILKNPPR